MPQESSSPDGAEAGSRRAHKHAAILEAARQVFLANGFLGASMDQVAAMAGVSKQTVYKHFIDKETLFREIVTNIVQAGGAGIPADALSDGAGSLAERLRLFSRAFLNGVMQPEVLQLRRLVIGEATRFPELGRAFYDLGPKRAAKELAVALVAATERESLQLDDPEAAAEHLLGLILAIPLNQAMLLGDELHLAEGALDQSADQGVRVFLRAYGLPED